MNPKFLNRSVDHNKSISVTRYQNKPLVNIWHYHEQVELVCIIKGYGTRFIGDNIKKYEPGDIVMIGENLPHMWQEELTDEKQIFDSDVVAVHLGTSFISSGVMNLPEYSSIKKLIEYSIQGIYFPDVQSVMKKFATLDQLSGFQQFTLVTEILNDLSSRKNFQKLTSEGFVEKLNNQKKGRLQLVHDYVMNNFRREIGLNSAANVANMNASSFSRYFKQTYGKTFTEYVNEIRVGYACNLVLEDDMGITQTCYQSGFNNISNFLNRGPDLPPPSGLYVIPAAQSN